MYGLKNVPGTRLMAFAVGLALVAACSSATDETRFPRSPRVEEARSSASAKAELLSPMGDRLGELTFASLGDGVRIQGQVAGLQPGSKHAIHVHEGSECTGPDFKSAGGHFAPDGNPHGAMGRGSHAGDLGNLTAGEDGVASLDLVVYDLRLEGESSALDRTVILHADADDLKSQPSGAAGSRMACGEVRND